MRNPTVLVEGLTVYYGRTAALLDVDLDVAPGTTLGVLGHNGAGKTTLIRVLTTLVRPDAGRASVDGFDVVGQAEQVRQRIGVTGQYAGLDEFLTGRENLELIGRLTGLGRAARPRAAALIERLRLDDLAEQRAGEMSGGSRRRIDLAASLVGSPSVLVLDEPTTGLDPTARAALWGVVDDLTTTGTTVVLTTQYLDEADRLADDIVVLDHGRIAARGTPAELKRIIGGKVVTATIPTVQLDRLPQHPDTVRTLRDDHVSISFTADGAGAAAELVAHLARSGVDVADLDVTSPSLDDVFAHLTLAGARS
jgi:ABC-2 type transport system ATP-binding protein